MATSGRFLLRNPYYRILLRNPYRILLRNLFWGVCDKDVTVRDMRDIGMNFGWGMWWAPQVLGVSKIDSACRETVIPQV